MVSPGAFFYACKKAAGHDRTGTRCNRFYNIASITNPTITDDRYSGMADRIPLHNEWQITVVHQPLQQPRVVQILPGPTPTLTPSTPASTRACAPAPVATFPPIIWRSGKCSFTVFNCIEYARRMTMCRIYHYHINLNIDQSFHPIQHILGNADGGSYDQSFPEYPYRIADNRSLSLYPYK